MEARLYRLSSKSLQSLDYVDEKGAVVTRVVGQVPMMHWPDGRWCLEANLFLHDLLLSAPSTLIRGGTLLTYMSHITPLLRHCHLHQTAPIDLSDSDFVTIIEQMKRADNGKIKSASELLYVRAAGLTCLRFLDYVGRLYNDPRFVCEGGRIDIRHRETSRGGRGHRRSSVSLTHPCLPKPGIVRRRLPISQGSIDALNTAASSSPSTYLMQRRLMLIRALEITGGRRAEIASIRVAHVLTAAEMAQPVLRIETVKGSNIRLLPVTLSDLRLMLQFIKYVRMPHVSRSCGASGDDGFLFVSETRGKKLSTEYLTNEIASLRKSAGISERACAHMFRHRWITKLFVRAIERYNLKTPDEMKRALLSIETLKAEIIQYTGHRSVESLDHYVHLAFSEINETHDTLRQVLASESLTRALKSYAFAKSEKAPPAPEESLRQLASDILEDLCTLVNRSK